MWIPWVKAKMLVDIKNLCYKFNLFLYFCVRVVMLSIIFEKYNVGNIKGNCVDSTNRKLSI